MMDTEQRLHPMLLLVAAIAGASCGLGEDFAVDGYSRGGAEYLRLPIHAQSASLSGATTAWTGGLAGMQQNPAIVDAVKGGTAGAVATYSLDGLGRRHVGIDAATPVGTFVAAGFSFVHMGMAGFVGRDEVGDLTRDFDDEEDALALCAGGKVPYDISVGVRGRYLYQRIEEYRADGIGFDVGATWKPLPYLTVGISGLNLLSGLWWSTGHSDPVLPIARLGINGVALDSTLTVEVDFSKDTWQPMECALGIQYSIMRMFLVRGGVTTSIMFAPQDVRYPDFSFGAGMRYSMLGIDYSIQVPSYGIPPMHKVSVLCEFPRDLIGL